MKYKVSDTFKAEHRIKTSFGLKPTDILYARIYHRNTHKGTYVLTWSNKQLENLEVSEWYLDFGNHFEYTPQLNRAKLSELTSIESILDI